MIDNDSYPYSFSGSYMTSSFFSSGPKGDIQKIAQFSEIEPGFYNFGFGDLDEMTGNLSDTTTSNNDDLDMIMATLGNILIDFFSVYPDKTIFIMGSDPARTRLYQMQINKHWEKIKPHFVVIGLFNDDWPPFKKGVNYQAFKFYRKNLF